MNTIIQDTQLVKRLANSFGAETHQVAARACLLPHNQTATQLYAICSGQLRVCDSHGIELYTLSAGDVAGALSLWTELTVPVQIETVTDAEVVAVSAETFRNLLKIDRPLRNRLAPMMQARMRRLQLARVLHQLFANDNPTYVTPSSLDNALYQDIAARAKWVHLQHGETLFHEGERTEDLFVVVNGRLELQVDGRTIATVKSAETIGATPIITRQPLSMSAVAVRETTLLALPAMLCVDVWRNHADTTLPFLRQALTRQQNMVEAMNAKSLPPSTIALIPATAGVKIGRFAAQIAAAMNQYANTHLLTRDIVNAQFDVPHIADIDPSNPAHPLLVERLNGLESAHDHLVYVGDPTWSEWTRRCLQQADRVLIVADFTDDHEPALVERAIFARPLLSRVDLVLLHPAKTEQPNGTARWLDARQVNTHFHVKKGSAEHLERLARRLTGRAIGLVLAGGGAKGYAHLGVMRRLEERAVPVDLIGGTSMGGLLGAAFAMGWDADKVTELSAEFASPKKLFDYTLPLVSLFRSGKVTRMIRKLFADQQIEDLWRPFFAVAANITANDIHVFTRGDLWRAVRGTMSLPGIFVPLADIEGDVLVDGGIVNNFPVDLMRERIDGGQIIGVTVDSAHRSKPYEHRPILSGWSLLGARLNPFGKRQRVPAIGSTLVRVAMMNNNKLMSSMYDQCDVLIRPNTREITLMGFEHYLRAAELGYEAAIEADFGALVSQ